MSFYKRLKDGEDTDFNDEVYLEEQYQKMFKKIARDFVHVDDLKEILRNVLDDILESDISLKRNAYLKAKEYEKNLNSKISNRKTYKDVDDLTLDKRK